MLLTFKGKLFIRIDFIEKGENGGEVIKGIFSLLFKSFSSIFWRVIKKHYICNRNQAIARALSSVGSEHLVYTQRVGGSNPSGPTQKRGFKASLFYCTGSR